MVSEKNRVFGIRLLPLLLVAALSTQPAARASLRVEQPLAEQAVKKVLGSTEKAVKREKFNFDAGVCFGIAVVARGDKIQTPYPLERGVRYLFIGGGDNNAQDINLSILDTKGKTLAQDAAPDAIPVVFFTPKYTGTYHLALRLAKAKTSTSFCSMVVMRKTGGYALPVSSIRSASAPSEKMSPEVSQVADQLRFHRVRNQWAAFGAVLKQGDATQVPGLRYESGNHVFVGGSDGRASDVDLALLSSSGQKLIESKQAGANPAMVYQTNGNEVYRLMLTNRRSTGASLVFLIALDIKGAAGGGGGSAPAVRRDITLQLNGEKVEFEKGGPIEINGRVMVPLVELFEALGADVEFNAGDNSYSLTEDDDEIILKIGSPVITVNGTPFQLDTAPITYQGIAMAPLRFFIQAAGAKVDWDGQRRLVSITMAMEE